VWRVKLDRSRAYVCNTHRVENNKCIIRQRLHRGERGLHRKTVSACACMCVFVTREGRSAELENKSGFRRNGFDRCAPGTLGCGGRVCSWPRGSWERVQNGDCGASPTFRVTVDVRGAFISEGPPRLFLLLGWLLFYETLADHIIILYMRRCRGRRDDDGLSAAACPRAHRG